LLLLAIDDHSLPFRRHLACYLTKPDIREEAVLAPRIDNPTAPDRAVTHFYGTVLHDEGKFRMWYYAMNEVLQRPHETSMVCYAESDDGIHWTRPNLGQKEVKGSRDNNALDIPGRQTYAASVIKDEGDPDPRRRYKIVYNPVQDTGPVADRFGQAVSTLGTATSPDGIRWTVAPEWPIDVFAEQSAFYQHDGMYYVHGQGIFAGGGEGGSEHGRQGYVWVSPDFREWAQGSAETFTLPEPVDPSQRGYEFLYDQVHLGVGAANFGNVQVGVFGLWHQGKGEPPLYTLKGTSCDLGLVVSNDGIHFREPVKGHVYISGHESSPTPVEGKEYPTILCQGNGILNVGDETLIYHGRWRNTGLSREYRAEVGLAKLPRDRWGALGLFPQQSEGWVWSAPVTMPEGGVEILLNADHPELTRVEVTDERLGLLSEYSGANSGVVKAGGGIESAVSWPAADPSALLGKNVRLKVHLRRERDLDPRLYAVHVKGL